MVLLRMIWVLAFIITLNSSVLADSARPGESGRCNIQALSQAVHNASIKLRHMKEKYRNNLHKQLVILKRQKGWSDQEFILKAQPLIQNKSISDFDDQNKKLVSVISSLNHSRGNKAPDCEMFARLNFSLNKIIQNTQNKWDHMLLNIKAETHNSH